MCIWGTQNFVNANSAVKITVVLTFFTFAESFFTNLAMQLVKYHTDFRPLQIQNILTEKQALLQESICT